MQDSFPVRAHLVTVSGSTLNRAATSPGVINSGCWPLPLAITAATACCRAASSPAPPAVAHLTSLMVSMSCSLPQTGFGPELHAEMVPSAIALPLAYAFPGCAITSTRMVWVLFVHPTCADPNPLAIFLLTLSVRVTKTEAVLAPAHSILSVTLTPAPLATSVAGDTSWICSSSGGEKKATAGPAGATAAIAAPPTTATAARAFFVLNRCRITVVLSFGGQGARAADRVIDGAARPTSTATLSGIAGTCQRKSKPLCTAKAVTPATAPAHRAGSGGSSTMARPINSTRSGDSVSSAVRSANKVGTRSTAFPTSSLIRDAVERVPTN